MENGECGNWSGKSDTQGQDFDDRQRSASFELYICNSPSADFRYMCISDLHNELQKENFKVDGDTEKRITDAILKQLEDTSADVSGLAFKWCGFSLSPEAQLAWSDLPPRSERATLIGSH